MSCDHSAELPAGDYARSGAVSALPRLIDRFIGKWAFLSNYYPCAVWLDGQTYPSVEHAYQAAKTCSPQIRRSIRLARDGDEAKRIGRASPQRPDWEARKVEIMRGLVAEKFDDPQLRDRLRNTGQSILIEGNDWGDEF